VLNVMFAITSGPLLQWALSIFTAQGSIYAATKARNPTNSRP